MNDEIRKAIMQFQTAIDFKEAPMPMNYSIDLENAKKLLDYITNLQKENDDLQNRLENAVADCNLRLQENERLKKEVAKLHIIQEEYGSHIENTHIIDDYQKTYFMTNKWLIELKDGRFVDINVLNSYYEDYKSRVEKAVEYINKNKKVVSKYEAKDTRLPLDTFMWGVDNLLNILQNGSESK